MRPFGYNGYVTCNGRGHYCSQSQRLYSGVGIFSWHYLSSPKRRHRDPGVHLERRGLIYIYRALTRFPIIYQGAKLAFTTGLAILPGFYPASRVSFYLGFSQPSFYRYPT